MVAWGKFPFVRFVIALCCGVIFYNYLGNPFSIALCLFPAFSILYLIVVLRKKTDNLVTGLLAFCCTFCFGIVLTNLHDALFYKDNISYKQFSSYVAEVTSDVEDRGNFYKAEASVVKIKTKKGWEQASGKVLLYIIKNSLSSVKYGNRLLVKTPPQELKAPLNPGEFDYKKYLSFQNVYHQQFLSSYQYQKLPTQGGIFFMSWAFYIRHSCDSVLKANISAKAYPIASALVLGIRNSLDDEVKQAYSSTGTIHVLAVSGMHIVVIYGMLFLVFGFIKNLRGGDVLFTAVIFALLWLYAFITGFSPSVVRAVTMFSFVLLAQLINRRGNIYNTLALSAFIMLCFNPYLLMDAGFQLSYLAVLGIVLLYNPIYKLVEFKNKVADRVWAMASVSVAAQIATAPLTMYYFNQFSFSFLLANFVAIPLSSVALFTSLGIIAFCWISPLASMLGCSTNIVIDVMNQSILLLNKIPYLAIKEINISLFYAILLYLLISAILVFFTFKRFNYLLSIAFVVFIMGSLNILTLLKTAHRKQLVVFSIRNHTAVALIKSDKGILFADSLLLKDSKKLKQVITLLSKMNVSCTGYKIADNKLIIWEGKSIFIGGSGENYNAADFIILKNIKSDSKFSSTSSVIYSGKDFDNNKHGDFFNISTKGAYIKDI